MRWCWERAEACIKENHFGKEVRKVVKKKVRVKKCSAAHRALFNPQPARLSGAAFYLFIHFRQTYKDNHDSQTERMTPYRLYFCFYS